MLVLHEMAQQQHHQRGEYGYGDGMDMKPGGKRELDNDGATFMDFLADMKKRRVEPVYDSGESQPASCRFT